CACTTEYNPDHRVTLGGRCFRLDFPLNTQKRMEDTPQEESDPLSAEQAQALLTLMGAMRDQFTKLEGEVVLLRESVCKQQPDIHTIEELLTKVRTEQDSSLATQLKEVQQERDGLKRELADLTKEVRDPEETLAEIVLLMDSNGKFVQQNKLFPRHKTRKRQHPGPAPWTPQPLPQHHQPQCPPQPAQHRLPQPSFRPTQMRSTTPLPPTADPHLEEPQPGRQSYAQAVRGATGPAPTNEMSDIKQMLNLLCSHVVGRGS
ncbi:unnamed protein product, partial [Coregonus sp. 'balchen']